MTTEFLEKMLIEDQRVNIYEKDGNVKKLICRTRTGMIPEKYRTKTLIDWTAGTFGNPWKIVLK